MKLAVVDNVNGIFKIESEWVDNEQGAIVAFHQRCAVLWNADDVLKATVKILDEQLDNYMGYSELIVHEPSPEPEPESEPEPEPIEE